MEAHNNFFSSLSDEILLQTNFKGHEKFVAGVAFMDRVVVSGSGIFSPYGRISDSIKN
jgi:hypothetical protein